MDLSNSVFERADYNNVGRLTLIFKHGTTNPYYRNKIDFYHTQTVEEIVKNLRKLADTIEEREIRCAG